MHLGMQSTLGDKTGRQNQLCFTPWVKRRTCLVSIYLHICAKYCLLDLLPARSYLFRNLDVAPRLVSLIRAPLSDFYTISVRSELPNLVPASQGTASLETSKSSAIDDITSRSGLTSGLQLRTTITARLDTSSCTRAAVRVVMRVSPVLALAWTSASHVPRFAQPKHSFSERYLSVSPFEIL
jgi:hypothetical protein